MPAIRGAKTGKQQRHNPMGGGGAGSASSLPVNKAFGQHLLKNPGIIEKIIAAADIKPSDTAFEIGPGTGILTMRLLETAKRVVAIEVDPRMSAEVRKRAMSAGRMNLEVREGDVLRSEWPVFDICVANMPYQISSPFMFKLLAHKSSFRCAVLMFQKEFAERLIAKVGEPQYGRLAVNTSLFVKISCVCKVSRGSFNPPPEVDSMVVKVVPREPRVEVDFKEWDGLMRICFSRKRKTLRASFTTKDCMRTLEENYSTWCALTDTPPSKEPIKDIIVGVLDKLELADKRAITIDLDTFFRLQLEFNKAGIHFSNATGRSSASLEAASVPDDLFIDNGMEEG